MLGFSLDGSSLGHDCVLHLPNLLSRLFWFIQNGWLMQPWFSPAQCGGIPYMGDMNVLYYSLPQHLIFIMSPMAAMAAEAEKFLTYRSYTFTLPWWQTMANRISFIALLSLLAGLFVILINRKKVNREP